MSIAIFPPHTLGAIVKLKKNVKITTLIFINVAYLKNIHLFSMSKFYSRNVITKLGANGLSNLRKVETLLMLCIKQNADIL